MEGRRCIHSPLKPTPVYLSRFCGCYRSAEKHIFFPSKGILGQAAQARGRRINATIGIALEEDGTPMRSPVWMMPFHSLPGTHFPHAPSYGKAELRDRWAELIRSKNPDLTDSPISRPVVTSALTHALSVAGYLFLDDDEEVILSDLYWGNYGLIFKNAYGAHLVTYPTFDGEGFNVDGLKAQLLAGPPGKRVVVLNFRTTLRGTRARLTKPIRFGMRWLLPPMRVRMSSCSSMMPTLGSSMIRTS